RPSWTIMETVHSFRLIAYGGAARSRLHFVFPRRRWVWARSCRRARSPAARRADDIDRTIPCPAGSLVAAKLHRFLQTVRSRAVCLVQRRALAHPGALHRPTDRIASAQLATGDFPY